MLSSARLNNNIDPFTDFLKDGGCMGMRVKAEEGPIWYEASDGTKGKG